MMSSYYFREKNTFQFKYLRRNPEQYELDANIERAGTPGGHDGTADHDTKRNPEISKS
jgi:hypothetical protein